jgi:hypothetical protein
MKAGTMILGTIILLFVSVSSVTSQELRFLGRDAVDSQKGWIQIQGQYYQVVVGTVISGWGTVTEIANSHLVTEYALTESEVEKLRNQGAAVYRVLQVKIPHEDLRLRGK